MWRVAVPAVFMISTALLIAGAVGDLPSWREDWPAVTSRLTETAGPVISAVTQARPAPDGAADQARQAQKRQAEEQQAQIARATRDLAAVRATLDQTRQELASLRQRRDQEQSALSQIAARQQVPAPVTPIAAAPIAAPAATPPTTPRDAASAPAAGLVVARLMRARADLSSGRRVQARRQLRFLRSQIARLPQASPDHQDKVRGQVEYAIALLDRGDRGGAMQTIDQALAEANGETGAPARPPPPDSLR